MVIEAGCKISEGNTVAPPLMLKHASDRMSVNKFASVKSVIKGHHVYRISYSCGTKLDCFLEPENQHSDSAIIVKKGDSTIGHIPEGLCQPLTQLHKDGNIAQITSEITGSPRSVAEGTFVPGGGLEIPCVYHLFGQRDKKEFVFGDKATNSETFSIR